MKNLTMNLHADNSNVDVKPKSKTRSLARSFLVILLLFWITIMSSCWWGRDGHRDHDDHHDEHHDEHHDDDRH
jgi:hypothetical protein